VVFAATVKSYFFCLCRKQNVKFSAGVNVINVLRTRFWYEIFGAKISNPKASFVVFGAKSSYEKCAHKMLMKFSPG